METLIVVCLIIVIILLLKDKVVIHKPISTQKKVENRKQNLPEIMGQPKPLMRQVVPTSDADRQKNEQQELPDNFKEETEEKGFEREIPQEELDEVFGSEPYFDFSDEEEEWREQGVPNSDNGFATGVTFNELSTIGALLQQDGLEPVSQQQAVNIVQKIQGTELFSLLENSIPGASRKIAALLDKNFPTGTDLSSSYLRKSDPGDFDIGEFV